MRQYTEPMGTYMPERHAEARRLRRDGRPPEANRRKLGVAVSTVHLWTEDIELTREQNERNRTGPGGPHNPEWIRKRAAAWSARKRAERQRAQDEGRRKAREGDPLHIAGCMLHWAEGSKGRNIFSFRIPTAAWFASSCASCASPSGSPTSGSG